MTRQKHITSKSWFVLDSFSSHSQIQLTKELIKVFSEEGDVVFDPLLGNAETLFSCNSTLRNGVSISADKTKVEKMSQEIKVLESQLKLGSYGSTQLSKQLVLHAGIENLDYIWQQYSLPNIDFMLSVLPNWNTFLRVASTFYPGHSVSPLAVIENIILALYSRIKDGAYIVLVAQNEHVNNKYTLLAFEIIELFKKHFTFKYEKIACVQKQTELPATKSEIAHKYLLVFRKE